jgi:FeS assembly SUF system protein
MPTTEQITEVLKTCYDPEIPVNIVDLGLIYNIDIKKGKVGIKMTLTAPGCPMSGMIMEEIKSKVGTLKGVKVVEVEMLWDPAWSPDKMSQEAKLQLGII